ncbi:MAG: hypothetical protein ACRDLB_15815 [Actinomycetota bacterium]
MRFKKDERGVAMVTVILIGAALTSVTTVAAFATIKDFHSGRDDRKAAEALSYAEAGVDRFVQYMRSGQVNYNLLNKAGCAGVIPNGTAPLSLPPGQVGGGTFTATLTVYNPFAANAADRFPPAACANRPTTPHPGQGGDLTYFVITSTGEHPVAKRVVQQVVAVKPVGLPIGLYANAFDLKAHPQFNNISMVSETTITDRSKDRFTGADSYYKMSDFFTAVTGRSLDEPVPAAAHAVTGIYLKKSGNPEFASSTKNCTANSGDSQSLWDSDGSSGSGLITSGCTGQVGYPDSSKFTSGQLQALGRPSLPEQELQALEEAAKNTGVFCSFPGVGGSGSSTCVKQGVTQSGTAYPTYIQEVINSGTRNMVAFFEYRSGSPTQNNLGKTGTVWGCNPDPALNKSITVVVRNGGVNYSGAGGDMVNGAFIIDGNFEATGSFTFNGTIVSKGTVSFGSSSELIQMDGCWVTNMPGPFLTVEPGAWREIDR